MPRPQRQDPLAGPLGGGLGWFFGTHDAARIGQRGTLASVWAERDSRPRAPRDQR